MGFWVCTAVEWSRSSVSVVSDYGLDYRANEVRSPVEVKDFSSVPRPALRPTQPPVQWVLVVLSLGVKPDRGVTLTAHLHLGSGSRFSRSYTSSPPYTSIVCCGTASYSGRIGTMVFLGLIIKK
jgi:hypothetical protein